MSSTSGLVCHFFFVEGPSHSACHLDLEYVLILFRYIPLVELARFIMLLNSFVEKNLFRSRQNGTFCIMYLDIFS